MDPDELRGLRDRLRLTQGQLAERLGITPSAVARWEQGQRGVPEPVARLLRLLSKHPNLMDEVMAQKSAPTKPRRRGGR